MSDKYAPYGSERYTGLMAKVCQAKIAAARLAPYGSERFAALGTKQQAQDKGAGQGPSRLIRQNARHD